MNYKKLSKKAISELVKERRIRQALTFEVGILTNINSSLEETIEEYKDWLSRMERFYKAEKDLATRACKTLMKEGLNTTNY